MSVAQAAATLAATVIGFNVGLYGSDVVNAVMVVVAVSLIVTSVGTNRFAPRSPRPSTNAGGQARRSSCRSSASSTGSRTCCGSAAISPTRPAGSSSHWCRSPRRGGRHRREPCEAAEVDRVLRELGGDAETMLRVNRSVSAGLHEAAIEIDASLLLLGWPGPDDLRARMVGATYSEIVAATSVPVAIAALHPDVGRGGCPLLGRS
jgi:hypothetical protein